MCGISGFWWRDQRSSSSELERLALEMGRRLRLRGPDDEGVWVDETQQLALSHRRLAIVDLSPAGHQPMASINQRFQIIFNGEIYNFKTLRAELKGLGHSFRSTGDTEVMLAAFVQWGVLEAVRRFAGMFAFALWDAQAQELHLCRDRLGKKPLYLAQTPSGLAFASELKAFWALPGFDPAISAAGLEGFLRYGYVADNLCIFETCSKVMPGELLTVQRNGARSSQCYWSLAEVVRAGQLARISDPKVAQAELLATLRLATQERMVADVPIGAFLSGGIDSGLVVALMQEQATQATRTFSIGFEERSHDEVPVAREVAKHLGTQHTELYVTQRDAVATVERLPDIFDEPFADASQIPTAVLADLARQHVTVTLTGDGGDESFGGYVRYRNEHSALRHLYKLPAPMRQALRGGMQAVPEPVWARIAGLMPAKRRPGLLGSKVQKLARALGHPSGGDRDRLFLTYWHEPPLAAGMGSVRRTEAMLDAASDLNLVPSERMQYWETQHYLPGDLLVKMDRACMASSLEARSPLLDHRVVELAWRLSPDLKAGPDQLKSVLRELLFRYVPQDLVDRPKQGFSIPLGVWLRGDLREFAEEALAYARRELKGLLDLAPVEVAWRRHLLGHAGQAERIWTIVMFASWHRRWMGASSA